MVPAVFLVLLFIALLIATYRDVLTREVPDTVSYGLITLGLLGGLIMALIVQDLWIFLEHLFGFLIGLVIGLVMFYGRQWGGGDAKLIMGVGAVLGFSMRNLQLLEFVVLLVLCGALYGVIVLLYMALIKHRKAFIPAFKEHIRTKAVHRVRITLVVTGFIGVIAAVYLYARGDISAAVIIGFILVALYLLVYSWIFMRIVEKKILTKEYVVSRLTEGDWVVEEVKVGRKIIIKAENTGITPEQIAQLKKAKVKQVLVKEGIPFVPGFLIAFIILMMIQLTIGDAWLLHLFA